MRATCPPPPPRRLAGSVDCAGPRGGLRLACWGRSRRHTGKVTSVRARAGARGPRGPRCGGLCAGRSPALPPSVSATSSVPGQQQPASPLRRPRREVTAPALPACCGSPQLEGRDSDAVPVGGVWPRVDLAGRAKGNAGFRSCPLRKIADNELGAGRGGGHQPGADAAAGADAGRGRQSLHSLSFLSKSIKLYETEHNLLARK